MNIKNFPFYRRYTTAQNKKYWANRTYGWDEYLKTAGHPHRSFISNILGQLRWTSLFEIGCGSGPNLANVISTLKGKQVGGIDINPHAIDLASKKFVGGYFKVGSADDILLSDKSVDVVLSDAFLIYIGPLKIRKYLLEAKRIARSFVVLVEYHEKSWWRRQYLRLFSGRHSYDYQCLLQKLGFYDTMLIKMPSFEQDNDERFRYVIVAKVPNK